MRMEYFKIEKQLSYIFKAKLKNVMGKTVGFFFFANAYFRVKKR